MPNKTKKKALAWAKRTTPPGGGLFFSRITFVPRYLHGRNLVGVFRPTTRSRPWLGWFVFRSRVATHPGIRGLCWPLGRWVDGPSNRQAAEPPSRRAAEPASQDADPASSASVMQTVPTALHDHDVQIPPWSAFHFLSSTPHSRTSWPFVVARATQFRRRPPRKARPLVS